MTFKTLTARFALVLSCILMTATPALASGLPLGVMADGTYHQSQVQLGAGDRRFLYTDGVLEAPDTDVDFFGEARLIAALNHTVGDDLGRVRTQVFEALVAHTSNQLGHDDVTFMAIELK